MNTLQEIIDDFKEVAKELDWDKKLTKSEMEVIIARIRLAYTTGDLNGYKQHMELTKSILGESI